MLWPILLPFDQRRALVAVIEMSNSSWLVSGTVPGIDRQPLKKLEAENPLLRLLHRWKGEAERRAEKAEHRAWQALRRAGIICADKEGGQR